MSDPGRDRELGHAHESDGIEEYDNALPAWWLGLFFVCVVWAAMYTVHYHVSSGRSQTGEYVAEMQSAAVRWKRPEPVAALAADPRIEAGKKIFASNCAGCHAADGGGGVGPNLRDATWIHGGTLADITRTITEGVPAKGMITWGPILGTDAVAQVAAYVHALGGGVGEGIAAPAGPTPASVDPALVAAGNAVFAANCVGCHGAAATGGVGPNLTDASWIHGGSLEAIQKVVSEGVPAKGMITWAPVLGEEKVRQVSAYVHSLGGGQ
jgi:cytochrome c oxidase cbb3-type subunit 3